MERDTLNQPPPISVILPTFNRARFLPRALESIRRQSFVNWELIVIDDGSTDDTREVLEDLLADLVQPYQYVYQQNQGAYAARKAGVKLARGEYLAFYDSDDLWLPHHLQRCVQALEANPDVDWVYGASRIVDERSGRIISPTTFYVQGKPRPFRKLHCVQRGNLHVIDDPAMLRCSILHGLFCGLQNSMLRRRLLATRSINTTHRNEAEDQLMVARAAAEGARFAYYDEVHLLYNVHDQNSSASAQDQSTVQRQQVLQGLLRGYEELRDQLTLTAAENRALNRRLSREYFWRLGYAVLWQSGEKRAALEMFRRGLQLWPWSLSCWKTYLISLAKTRFGNALA